jgi:hypothetical protein
MLRFARLLTSAAGLALLCLPVTAADPLPVTKPASPFVSQSSDRLLSLNVSMALANDPEMAHLPILVDVLNKVAILGGGVPDESTKEKLEAVVRKVPGIKEVKNGCWIRQGDDPLKQMVNDRLDGLTGIVARDATQRLPSIFVMPPESQRRTVDEPLAVLPVSQAPPVAMQTRPSDRRMSATVTVHRVPLSPLPGLEAPLKASDLSELPMPGATATASPYPTIPATNLRTKPLSLEEEIQRVQQSQLRWKAFQISTSGSTVRVSGKGYHSSDIWAFTEAIRHIPGIERILVTGS